LISIDLILETVGLGLENAVLEVGTHPCFNDQPPPHDALSTGLDNLSTLRVSAGQTWLLLQQLLQ